MIKVICLDLGKVIVDYDPTIPLTSLGTHSALSLPEIKQVLTDREPLLRFDRGHYSRSDFYRTMCARLRLDVSTEEFEQLWTSLFLPEPLLAESFLLSLKRRYRLLMLSNVNEVHFEFIWKNYPLVRHIEDRLLSYELGCLKPESSIYRHRHRSSRSPPPRNLLRRRSTRKRRSRPAGRDCSHLLPVRAAAQARPGPSRGCRRMMPSG